MLDPVGVAHVTATVTAIDPAAHTVTADGRAHRYDRLVLAAGSQVARPDIPGLREYGFDVDTYDAAMRLDAHLRGWPPVRRHRPRATVVVVGAGLTGIETACELPDRLRATVRRDGAATGRSGRPQSAASGRTWAIPRGR